MQGINDALFALSKGASLIEKHFTINKNLPGRDNKFAILPKDLKKISEFRNNFLEMITKKNIDLQDGEMDIYNNYRGRWG